MKPERRLLLLFLFFISTGYSFSPRDIARKIENRLFSLQSLQADFEQAYYPAYASTPLRERGRLYFQKPDRMRWEYLEPEAYIYLYKEGTSLALFPEDNQLYRHTLSPEERDSELFSLFLGASKIEDRYFIEPASFPSEKKNPLQIKLTPKRESEVSYILLEAEEATWLIRTLLLFDPAGNKQEYRFSRIKPNSPLAPRTFELEVPPGCEVIEDVLPIKK